MNQRVLIAVVTLALIAAGFGVGVWTERHRPLPPPPLPFMGEMGGRGHAPQPPAWPAPASRTELAAEIERMRPQIEAFRRQIDQIEADFDRDLLAVLSPPQRELYGARRQQHGWYSRHEPGAKGDRKSISAEQIAHLQQRPMFHVVDMVVVALRLDWLNRELKLDEGQRERVRALLHVRRDRFLALIDTAPLPSLFLSRLAPIAERLAEPAK